MQTNDQINVNMQVNGYQPVNDQSMLQQPMGYPMQQPIGAQMYNMQ